MIGAYREEFEAAYPDLAGASRAELVTEGIQALRVLFEERRGSFAGAHYRFHDVEMYPKPKQQPLPIYSAGNADGSIRRAAELCEGWLPAGIGPERIRASVEKLAAYARAAGRDPSQIAIAPQLIVCLGESADAARAAFERSQLYHHLVSLQQSTLRGVSIESYLDTNLVGTPAVVRDKVEALASVGVSHLCGLYFVGNTVDEMMGQVRQFAADVVPAFPETMER